MMDALIPRLKAVGIPAAGRNAEALPQKLSFYYLYVSIKSLCNTL